jgi:hypothetical protein
MAHHRKPFLPHPPDPPLRILAIGISPMAKPMGEGTKGWGQELRFMHKGANSCPKVSEMHLTWAES